MIQLNLTYMEDNSHKRSDRHGRLLLGVEDIVKVNKEQKDKRTRKAIKTNLWRGILLWHVLCLIHHEGATRSQPIQNLNSDRPQADNKWRIDYFF